MAALFVFFGYSTRIHLEEDINKLMPSSKNEDGTTKLAFADLKIKDKVFVTFEWIGEGETQKATEQLTSVCDAFVDSLLAQDKDSVIGDVFYRLDEDLLPDAIDYMTAHLPAYIDTAAYARFDTLLTREHFERQMQQNREDLTGEFGELFPELIQMDPMGMRGVLAEQLKSIMSAGSYQTVDDHFFVPDSTVCLAFITPRFSSTNTGQGSAMFQMMNQQIDQFTQAHPDVRISYHGTPASGFYNSTQIKHDLTTTIAGALLLVLLFLLFCFRRWDTIPLLLLPVVFGTLFGLAMMYWLKGEFSLLALGIGGVVLGVAMSYVLHVLTHHRYVSDTDHLLQDQVKPVLLGCITTIGSFAGLIFVNTDLLRDFGLFAAFAILGTTLFSLAYLPQMLKEKGADFPAFIENINNYPFDRKKPLIAVVLIVTIVSIGAYLIGGTHFDADMHNLGYEAEITEHSENLLRDKTYTGDKTKYFASQGRTMEEAIANFAQLDRKLDSLQRIGLVKSYTHTNQLLVPLNIQQARIDAWHRYWNQERQATVRRLISETATKAGLNAEAFNTFFEAANADYETAPLYEAGIIPEGYLSTLTEQSYGGDYLVFTSVRCQNDSVRSSDSDYIRICDAISSDPHLLVLDTYYYTTDTLLQMSRDFDTLQWLSMAFVFVVLLLSFNGNIKHTLLGFAPILLSWLGMMKGMEFPQHTFRLEPGDKLFVFTDGVPEALNSSSEQFGTDRMLKVLNENRNEDPAGLLAAVILSYVLQPAVWRLLNGKQ